MKLASVVSLPRQTERKKERDYREEDTVQD